MGTDLEVEKEAEDDPDSRLKSRKSSKEKPKRRKASFSATNGGLAEAP